MAGIEVDFEFKHNEDIRAATKRLEELQNRSERSLDGAMEEATLRVMGDARENAPVDTGRLRASIEQRVEDERGTVTGYVGSNVEYAKYQEIDRRYLRDALDGNERTIGRLFGAAIEQAVDEVSE